MRSFATLRGCDFFCAIECVCGYKECMSYPGAGEAAGEVRLRKPERRQMEWVPQCTDDLVAATHGVRTVAAVVAKLDLSAFREPIKAREGVAGPDATPPPVLVWFWVFLPPPGLGPAPPPSPPPHVRPPPPPLLPAAARAPPPPPA